MGSNQQKFPDACGDLQQSSHQDMIGNPIWKPFGLISLWGTTFESAHQPGSSFRSLKFLLAKCWCVFFASTRTWSLKTGSYQKLSVFRFMAGAPKAGWDGHPISGVFLRHIWGVLNPKCWNSTPHLPGLQPNKAEIWCIFRCSCWTQNIPQNRLQVHRFLGISITWSCLEVGNLEGLDIIQSWRSGIWKQHTY